jgi:NAD(P)H-hydrate repair Nnr-like enzyme with NAD(P)H-hydrate epimerase domain
VPPGPVAVSEKVVVAVIGVIDEPEVGSPFASSGIGTAGVMVTDVAFVVAHVRVDVCPAPTVVGVAVNWVICGTGGGGGDATCTATVCGELVPPVPVATAE